MNENANATESDIDRWGGLSAPLIWSVITVPDHSLGCGSRPDLKRIREIVAAVGPVTEPAALVVSRGVARWIEATVPAAMWETKAGNNVRVGLLVVAAKVHDLRVVKWAVADIVDADRHDDLGDVFHRFDLEDARAFKARCSEFRRTW